MILKTSKNAYLRDNLATKQRYTDKCNLKNKLEKDNKKAKSKAQRSTWKQILFYQHKESYFVLH